MCHVQIGHVVEDRVNGGTSSMPKQRSVTKNAQAIVVSLNSWTPFTLRTTAKRLIAVTKKIDGDSGAPDSTVVCYAIAHYSGTMVTKYI